MGCKVVQYLDLNFRTPVRAFLQDRIGANRPYAPIVCVVEQFDVAGVGAAVLSGGCPAARDGGAGVIRWVNHFMESLRNDKNCREKDGCC